jgi:hypothetical protein
MNKSRLLKLATIIEAGRDDLAFNMHAFANYHSCGTVACIGGWTMVAFGKLTPENILEDGVDEVEAAKLLGLTEDEAYRLFFPTGKGWNATPSEAAEVIREFALTGQVKWQLL